MSKTSLISIVVVVKNGMPLIKDAVELLTRQDCRDFEVIVQDAASTDGTTEYLESVTCVDIHLDSRPDNGISQAFNRAYGRCRGGIIGSVDADNWLEPNAISTAIQAFAAHPEAAAIYGSFNVVNESGQFVKVYRFPPFDRMKLLQCKLVPPFGAAFFNRAVCGDALFSDENVKHCTDFGIWLRLSDKTIVQIDDIIASVDLVPKASRATLNSTTSFAFTRRT